MNLVAARTPPLFPNLELTERVLDSPIGKLASGFHVHSVDDSLGEIFTESVMGTYHGLNVRSIRSLPRRPISLGPETAPGSCRPYRARFPAGASALAPGFRRHSLPLSGGQDRGPGEPELLRHPRRPQDLGLRRGIPAARISARPEGKGRKGLRSPPGLAQLAHAPTGPRQASPGNAADHYGSSREWSVPGGTRSLRPSGIRHVVKVFRTLTERATYQTQMPPSRPAPRTPATSLAVTSELSGICNRTEVSIQSAIGTQIPEIHW